jgi:predicted ATPase
MMEDRLVGLDLDAAEAVCGETDLGTAVLDGIESLLEKSLLGRAEGARFRLLETVREFAVERAGAAGELATFRRRHAAYFLGFAEAYTAGSWTTRWSDLVIFSLLIVFMLFRPRGLLGQEGIVKV